ncbi:MAG: asparagine synthase (glutamine-hydrolyzing) [Phycisphaeraceae bacterium]
MCGIAGAIGYIDDSITRGLRLAHDAMRHRGPDGDGHWATDASDSPHGVQFAHRRLAIIDLNPRANQPMVDADTGYALCYNGEIYNYRALRNQLRRAGYTFRSESDTEVLLKAYQSLGHTVVSRLAGMFSFAVWDPQNQRMLLARDRLGIKPVYHTTIHHDDGEQTFLFASELRALLATNLVPRRIDPTSLASYVFNGYVTGPRTIVANIHRLPPASYLQVDLAGRATAPVSYWTPPRDVPDALDEHEAVGNLRDKLHAAVHKRLVSDVPLGIFLSGGIDSSAVAALAQRGSDTPLRTFNVSFDEADFDESTYARAVASAIGADHHELRLRETDFTDQLDDALASLDQPTFDGINTYFVSRAVRDAGLTVALAGTGGDELFGGYRSFRDIPRAAKWGRRLRPFPTTLLHATAGLASRVIQGRPGSVPSQTRWGKLGDALSAHGDILAVYQSAYGLFSQHFLKQCLQPGLVNGELTHGLHTDRAHELADRIAGSGPLHAVSLLELASFLGERLLPDTDAASMACSLEVRVPLIDHELIEALALVPEQRRFHPLGRKQLLRDLALDGIDPGLFNRPKAGFVLPIERWCRRQLRDQIADTLEDAELCISVGLQPDAVANLWHAFEAGAPGIYWSRIWALFALLRWCRAHDMSLQPTEAVDVPV